AATRQGVDVGAHPLVPLRLRRRPRGRRRHRLGVPRGVQLHLPVAYLHRRGDRCRCPGLCLVAAARRPQRRRHGSGPRHRHPNRGRAAGGDAGGV
ncbi:MAG: hypothetical protein AVDCRST_MAG73-2761, partial [uncultured Thermomicrobiales bacterium]